MASQIYENHHYSYKELHRLKDICGNATSVVGWYHHPYEDGNVRGPYHRWINVLEGSEQAVTEGHIAPKQSDSEFICEAMNHFPNLVDLVIKQKAEINALKRDMNDKN